MEFPRVVISSTSSDSGKTLVTTALLWLLRKRGYQVQPFKVGPDYIDSGYHTIASGRASRNLDSWIMDKETIKSSFIRGATGADFSVIEGVRGLYEGASPLGDAGSTAHIAKILKAPIILVLDCQSITKSAAAYILGMRALDKEVEIAGVILNKVNDKQHEEKLRTSIANYTKTPVLGVIYRDSSLKIPKRHLGLLTTQENVETRRVIESASLMLEKNLDFDLLIQIMKNLPPITATKDLEPEPKGNNIKVGVFMDQAFTFYYPESIEFLKRLGINLITLNSLSDREVGNDLAGLLIGGGYPEVFAHELETNSSMRRDVKVKSQDGMPIVGEGGGLMYLCNSISYQGSKRKMVGIFEGEVVMKDKPQALSYVLLECKSANLLADKGDLLRGHEFHYSEIQSLKPGELGFRVLRGKGICNSMDGLMANQTIGMFTHLHYLASPKVAIKFLTSCKAYMRS